MTHRGCTVAVQEYSGNITTRYTRGEATICHRAVTVLPRYTPDALGWSYGLPRLIWDCHGSLRYGMVTQGRITVESRLIQDNPVTSEVDTLASHRDQSAWTIAHHVILCYIIDMPGSHRGYIGMFRGHPAYKARLHREYGTTNYFPRFTPVTDQLFTGGHRGQNWYAIKEYFIISSNLLLFYRYSSPK